MFSRNAILGSVSIVAMIMISCTKEYSPPAPPSPPPPQINKVLLKDISVAHLPSPYYHFEYAPDSSVIKASFASDFSVYDVFYDGKNISEMRNNIIVNHDTLRYLYDNGGKIGLIIMINDAGTIYRHVIFNYDGEKIKEIDWERKIGNVGYIIDRTLTFTYFPDDNVKEIREHRPAIDSQPEVNFATEYDQYDDKINVDDFALLHDAFHDHLFLLSGVRIQKNNPRMEIRTGDGDNYTADYTYTYNNDHAPLTKTGDVLLTKGAQSGQRVQTSTIYTYY